jgi:DNA-binding transcriptional ArsR family regulator
MDANGDIDVAAADMASAIGEPARARILYCLMDGHARTATELSVVAGVTPSTASAHLSRLKTANLVKLSVQGKHRYYSLAGEDIARVLEGLSVLAHDTGKPFSPRTPSRLRMARTCYDHLAGSVGVALHDRFRTLGWLTARSRSATDYELSSSGEAAFESLGVDVEDARARRRRFACACLDWSERRPHLGGALGAEFLRVALHKKWFTRELDSRAVSVTERGRKEAFHRFNIRI